MGLGTKTDKLVVDEHLCRRKKENMMIKTKKKDRTKYSSQKFQDSGTHLQSRGENAR